jgi:hypothetical protein
MMIISIIKKNSWNIIGAIIVGVLLFMLWTIMNNKPITDEDIAYPSDLETLIDMSAVVVKGTVQDNGTPRNLRRDKVDPRKEAEVIVPGTDYTVSVTEVLKGDVKGSEGIKVAISGGSYKGKTEKLKANIHRNREYYFFLLPSSMGAPYYFGSAEPFIFEITNGMAKAVSSDMDYQKVFMDFELNELVFKNKVTNHLSKSYE